MAWAAGWGSGCLVFTSCTPHRCAGEGFVETGRFDYTSVDAVFDGGCTGFLVTSQFNREKSATKAATALLAPYITDAMQGGGQGAGAADETAAPQHSSAASEGCAELCSEPSAEGGELPAAKQWQQQQPAAPPLLSIVKVACNGVSVLKLSAPAAAAGVDVVAIARAAFADIAAGKIAAPAFVQRICPFTNTCRATMGALAAAAQRTVARFAEQLAAAPPASGCVNFGVGFHSRVAPGAAPATAAGEAEGGAAAAGPAAADLPPAAGASNSEPSAQPDAACTPTPATVPVERGAAIKLLATAMQAGLAGRAEVAVNLKAPQHALMLDTVPIGGGGGACLLSILSADMFSCKPRIAVRGVNELSGAGKGGSANAAGSKKHGDAATS